MAERFKVGDRFSHQRTCDPYRPIYYAGASGDFNPIHIDPKVGEQAGMGGAILHGLCTMAWCTEAMIRFIGDPGKIRRVRVRFSRPVKPGDEVKFEGEVTAVADGKIIAEISARNQRGEDVLRGAVVEAAIEPE